MFVVAHTTHQPKEHNVLKWDVLDSPGGCHKSGWQEFPALPRGSCSKAPGQRKGTNNRIPNSLQALLSCHGMLLEDTGEVHVVVHYPSSSFVQYTTHTVNQWRTPGIMQYSEFKIIKKYPNTSCNSKPSDESTQRVHGCLLATINILLRDAVVAGGGSS